MKLIRKAQAFLTVIVMSTAFTSHPAQANAPDFISKWAGTWINQDSNTQGITRFVLTPSGNHKFKLQVFGKCQPTDCAWGTAEMVTYQRKDGYYFYSTANYNLKFKKAFG